MAGKHSKPIEPAHDGTDLGVPFDQLGDAAKSREFDASYANPIGYATRNFSPDQTNLGHNASGTTSG